MATLQHIPQANSRFTHVMRIVYRIGIYIFLAGLFLQLLFAGFGVFLGWWGKLIVIQSEFPEVFDIITENPSFLKDLEQYYRQSAGDTTRHLRGGTDSTNVLEKGANTGTNNTDATGEDAGSRGVDIIITRPVEEEARTTEVRTEMGNGAKAEAISEETDHAGTVGMAGTEASGAAGIGVKTEIEISKKDTTLANQAEKYAANYPKLPKVLIVGSNREEAYFLS